jgi:hypothetical protein
MRWAVEMRNVCNILITKSVERRPLVTPRRRWKDNIKMDLREILWECVDWMYLA